MGGYLELVDTISRRLSPGRSVPGDRRSPNDAAFVGDSQASALDGSETMRQSHSVGVDAEARRQMARPSCLPGDSALGR